jgi:flagellar biogenesis protein FliO
MLRAPMACLLHADNPAQETARLALDWSGLLQAALALSLVSLIAYLVLRALAKRGFGGFAQGPVQIEQRLFLDVHGGLLVIRVQGRRLLLATHRNAPARLITELDARAQDGEKLPPVPPDSRGLANPRTSGSELEGPSP